ncbi:MAG: hypothetical protein JRJ54_14750 [Deltaproteobacteria bacterium]|nr:hypothetical protein [Deltaproteobacteria bacterium]
MDDAALAVLDLFFDREKAVSRMAALGVEEFYRVACELYASYRDDFLKAIDGFRFAGVIRRILDRALK